MRCNSLLIKLKNRVFPGLALVMVFNLSVMAGGNDLENRKGPEELKAIQPVTITGKVTTSVDGTGLPGVTILVKDTQTGTVTDLNGTYRIEVPGADAILVFSFIGFETQEVAVGSQRVIDIVLLESAQALEEVVVTALGITREEKSLGYSVGSVDGENMNRVAQENVINSLPLVAATSVLHTGFETQRGRPSRTWHQTADHTYPTRG